MSVIEHVMSLEQLVTIEKMDLEERGERLADLMAENAKLREQGERLFDKTLELGTDNAKLREENERFIVKLNVEHIVRQNVESDNAKLRELVKDIYVDVWALGEWLEPYEQRMRDLGIEVD